MGKELIESDVAIKSLSCRVKEAFSRVVVRAIFAVVGEYDLYVQGS